MERWMRASCFGCAIPMLAMVASIAWADGADPRLADSRYHAPCLDDWPDRIDPPPEQTRKCVDHWLLYVYGAGYGDEQLEIDPFGFSDPTGHLRIRDLQLMIENVGKVCSDGAPASFRTRCERLMEGLRKGVDQQKGFHQSYGEVDVSFRPALEAALAGKTLTRKMLTGMMGPWDPRYLRKIRNAVFARHGRPFSSADLQEWFYGPAWPERWAGFPAKPKLGQKSFDPARLTAVDRANIKLVTQVEQEMKRGASAKP